MPVAPKRLAAVVVLTALLAGLATPSGGSVCAPRTRTNVSDHYMTGPVHSGHHAEDPDAPTGEPEQHHCCQVGHSCCPAPVTLAYAAEPELAVPTTDLQARVSTPAEVEPVRIRYFIPYPLGPPAPVP